MDAGEAYEEALAMSVRWLCERCIGDPVFVVLGDDEDVLLADVERHRLAIHEGVPGALRWIEHDDWERIVGDWDHCPLCKEPIETNTLTRSWQCSNTQCTLAEGGPYHLNTIQFVGPELS